MSLGGGKKTERKESRAAQKTTDTIKRLESLRKDATRTIGFRVDPHTFEQIKKYAEQQGLRYTHLVRSWVLQRAREEGIIK
jgi:predicted DNA binding CopG/RHH family protein